MYMRWGIVNSLLLILDTTIFKGHSTSPSVEMNRIIKSCSSEVESDLVIGYHRTGKRAAFSNASREAWHSPPRSTPDDRTRTTAPDSDSFFVNSLVVN